MISRKIFILIIICVSCNHNKINNKKITVIRNNSSLVYDDDIITSQNLERFFSKDSLFMRKTINVNDNFCRELKKIKDESKKVKKRHFSINLEAYDYAIIFDKDTLFLSRDLGAWRYKNKNIRYKNNIVNKVISNINFGNMLN